MSDNLILPLQALMAKDSETGSEDTVSTLSPTLTFESSLSFNRDIKDTPDKDTSSPSKRENTNTSSPNRLTSNGSNISNSSLARITIHSREPQSPEPPRLVSPLSPTDSSAGELLRCESREAALTKSLSCPPGVHGNAGTHRPPARDWFAQFRRPSKDFSASACGEFSPAENLKEKQCHLISVDAVFNKDHAASNDDINDDFYGDDSADGSDNNDHIYSDHSHNSDMNSSYMVSPAVSPAVVNPPKPPPMTSTGSPVEKKAGKDTN